MWNGEDQALLHTVVSQCNHPATAFEKLEGLQIPQAATSTMCRKWLTLGRELLGPLLITGARPIGIRFLFDQLHRQIHITQPLHIRPEQTAEEDHPSRSGQEIGIAVDLRYTFQEFRERSFGRCTSDPPGR